MTDLMVTDEPRALARIEPSAEAGTLALALMSDDEFSTRLAALKKGRDRMAEIQRSLMDKDVDYGTIPGTPKPTLLKPGAEKLCLAYSLAADFLLTRTIGDGVTEPHLSYTARCELHLGSLDGPIVGVGNGASNSWERRYRYRVAERSCPECGKATIIKGRAEYGGGWVCFRRKGGCGAKWPDGSPEIEGQELGQIDNPDPFDLDVTLAKMAEKRAHVDATLRATAASGIFTQDIEDTPAAAEQRPPDPQADPETGEVVDDGGLIGTVVTQGTQDFELRQGPDGYSLPFRLRQGRRAVIVVAHGALAEALHAMKAEVVGKTVTCYGRIEPQSFPKPNGPAVTYDVLQLARMKTGEWTLPAAVESEPAPTEAASVPMFSAEEEATLDAAIGVAS